MHHSRRSRTAPPLAVLALLALCGGMAAGGRGPAEGSPAGTFSASVVRVIDGDTLRLAGHGRSLRLWGLDAPETGARAGPAAAAALEALAAGRALACRGRDTDRYGRTVGQCFLPDGRDLAAAMIATGTAREYCRFSGNHYRTC